MNLIRHVSYICTFDFQSSWWGRKRPFRRSECCGNSTEQFYNLVHEGDQQSTCPCLHSQRRKFYKAWQVAENFVKSSQVLKILMYDISFYRFDRLQLFPPPSSSWWCLWSQNEIFAIQGWSYRRSKTLNFSCQCIAMFNYNERRVPICQDIIYNQLCSHSVKNDEFLLENYFF